MAKRHLFMVHVTYAFEILRPLQTAARARGDETAWFLFNVDGGFLREDEHHLATVADVCGWNPDAVYVPGNWVPTFFPGVKVQVFHGLANDDTGKRGHYRIRGLFDLYCTHAPEGTTIFQGLSKKYGHFRVVETGWPKLDPLYQAEIPAVREPDPHDLRPVVLYGSTFSPSLTSAPNLFETIKRLSETGRWRWLVTLHPKMDPKVVAWYKALQGPNLEFVDSTKGVVDLIQRADVMLCDTSSIALEFTLLNRPLVTFRTKKPGPHVLDIKRQEDLEAAIAKALTRPPDLLKDSAAYVRKLHAYTDGQSSQRILEATDALIAGELGTLKPKPRNWFRRLQIRTWMGYWS